jgi:hypothetical protein
MFASPATVTRFSSFQTEASCAQLHKSLLHLVLEDAAKQRV